MSDLDDPGERQYLGFYDVSRAHFHSPVEDKDPICPDGVEVQHTAMYGLRDAGKCFDTFAEGSMEKIQLTAGMYSNCVYPAWPAWPAWPDLARSVQALLCPKRLR